MTTNFSAPPALAIPILQMSLQMSVLPECRIRLGAQSAACVWLRRMGTAGLILVETILQFLCLELGGMLVFVCVGLVMLVEWMILVGMILVVPHEILMMIVVHVMTIRRMMLMMLILQTLSALLLLVVAAARTPHKTSSRNQPNTHSIDTEIQCRCHSCGSIFPFLCSRMRRNCTEIRPLLARPRSPLFPLRAVCADCADYPAASRFLGAL